MSYPRQKDKFDAWHKAMVAGATVDKPNYGKTLSRGKTSSTQRRRRKRRNRRSRAQKEES